MTDKDKSIKTAQWRKDSSINYFNSLNAALTLLSALNTLNDLDAPAMKKFIVEWRDWFIAEHDKYYDANIANIGIFDRKLSIARINATTTVDELKRVWISMSQDERVDADILKAKDEKKGKL